MKVLNVLHAERDVLYGRSAGPPMATSVPYLSHADTSEVRSPTGHCTAVRVTARVGLPPAGRATRAV